MQNLHMKLLSYLRVQEILLVVFFIVLLVMWSTVPFLSWEFFNKVLVIVTGSIAAGLYFFLFFTDE